MSMLSSGLIDVALMYTEDAVSFIAEANPLRLIGTYVNTPRTWCLHVPHSSKIRSVAELRGLCIGHAEERGAYLAFAILAEQEGCGDIRGCSRETFGSIRKSADAMTRGDTYATLWDKSNVKHLVSSGDWERIAEVEMPWPSVVIVGSKESLYSKAGAVRHFIHFAHSACEDFISFNEDDALRYLSACHGLGMQDALEFMNDTDWVCENKVAVDTIMQPLEYLKQTGYIDSSRQFDPMRFVAKQICIDPIRGLPMCSDDEVDDEDFFTGLPEELASVTSFPAELLQFGQQDMESNTHESCSEQPQPKGKATPVGLLDQTSRYLQRKAVEQLTQETGVASQEEKNETAVASWIRETGQPQQNDASFAAGLNGTHDAGGAGVDGGLESVYKGDADGGSNPETGLVREGVVQAEQGPVPAG